MAYLRSVTEWFLGVPPADPGQGTEWHFVHNFPWPPWVLLLFALGAALYVVLVYRRDAGNLSRTVRVSLVSLRLAAIGMLLFMLSETVLSIERTGLPYLVILLDVSGSMETPDQYQKPELQKSADQLISSEKKGTAATRLNLAKALLTRRQGEFLQNLQARYKLRIYTFSGAASWLANRDLIRPADIEQMLPLIQELKPNGDQTRPGVALRSVLNELRGTPPSAIVVISDGITTTTDAERLSTAADYARSKAVPVYTIGVGNEEPLRDLVLFDTLVDEVAFVDDPINFTAKLKTTGFAGKKVEIQLRQAGTTKVLARKEVQAGDDAEPMKLELTYTPPEVGEFDFILEAKPLPKEFRLDNNRETRKVSVRKEKIRVLLVDSVPRYEFRYLKSLLERNKTIELSTVLQDADPEYAEEDATAKQHFPVKKEDLFQFDVVLFGDVNLGYLSTAVQENLREFVRDKGGGLLMMAGPLHNPLEYRGTPLESLLPIEFEGARAPAPNSTITESFQPQLTIEGMKGSAIFRFANDEPESLQIWNKLPGLFWLLEAPQYKEGAIVFATHPSRTGSGGKLPVILMQRFGGGKVLFHATDDTWRWRFRVGDQYYGRYWIQAIRYLCRSRLIGKDRTAELSVDRSVYQRGDPVYLRLRFLDERLVPASDEGVTVVVERQGDAQRRVKLTRLPQAPAVFEGQLSQIPEGSYHAWVATPAFSAAPPAKDFRVESPLRETQTLRLDRAELSRTAERTQGKYYTFADADRLLVDLPPGHPVPLKTDDPIRLWNHWLALVLFTSLLSTEWILRKRLRLI
jgi:uncharacterized membrane protein